MKASELKRIINDIDDNVEIEFSRYDYCEYRIEYNDYELKLDTIWYGQDNCEIVFEEI